MRWSSDPMDVETSSWHGENRKRSNAWAANCCAADGRTQATSSSSALATRPIQRLNSAAGPSIVENKRTSPRPKRAVPTMDRTAVAFCLAINRLLNGFLFRLYLYVEREAATSTTEVAFFGVSLGRSLVR